MLEYEAHRDRSVIACSYYTPDVTWFARLSREAYLPNYVHYKKHILCINNVLIFCRSHGQIQPAFLKFVSKVVLKTKVGLKTLPAAGV